MKKTTAGALIGIPCLALSFTPKRAGSSADHPGACLRPRIHCCKAERQHRRRGDEAGLVVIDAMFEGAAAGIRSAVKSLPAANGSAC